MQPLRCYLMTLGTQQEWTVTVHRELESLTDSWRSIQHTVKDTTTVVHVGFGRPDCDEFKSLAQRFHGRALFTGSARFALDRVATFTKEPVGFVAGLPIYVALGGWGYECSEEDLRIASLKREDGTATRARECAWLASLQCDDPTLYDVASAFGIRDDDSYLKNESHLLEEYRLRLGRYRFQHLCPSNVRRDPCKLARSAPPWLLEMNIAVLNLPTRPQRILAKEGVTRVSDLQRFDEVGLLGLPLMGAQSIKAIADALLHELAPADEMGRPGATLDSGESVLAEMGRMLDDIDPKFADVLRRRMGFNRLPQTLQEIANEYGVTRQRVSQIELRGLQMLKVSPVWQRSLLPRIHGLLDGRSTPLNVVALSSLDQWFAGIEDQHSVLEYILGQVCDSPYSLVEVDGYRCLTCLTQTQWDQVTKQAAQLLERAAEQGWRRSQVRASMDALLTDGASELRDDLWSLMTQHAFFAQHNEDPTIISIGRGAEHCVRAVLQSSDRPLHFTKIAELVKHRFNRSIEIRRAHNASAEVGLLFDRGTYGLTQHLGFSDAEIMDIVANTEEILFSMGSARQWHASEICELLLQGREAYQGRLTPYTLTLVLQRSSKLKYLRRLVWTAADGENGPRSFRERIDVQQAVMVFLKESGGPLTSQQIKERLQLDRGIGIHFQIHATDEIVRLGPGLWGLIDRDLPFSERNRGRITDHCEKELSRRRKGIHLSEIPSLLHEGLPDLTDALDPTVVGDVCRRTGRMEVSVGGYLYQSDWDGPRRTTIPEAIKIALAAARDGLSMKQMVGEVSRLLERPVSKDSLYTYLAQAGATWNDGTGCWILEADVDLPQ